MGRKVEKLKQISILDLLQQNERVRSAIRFLIHCFDIQDVVAISRGTVLEKIIDIFNRGSDIPLEIPFMGFLAAWSAYLNKAEVHTQFGNDVVYTDIWNVVLAESGTGKSYTLKKLREILQVEPILTFGTAAGFIKRLAEGTSGGKGLVVKDEFAEFLRQLETLSYMQELKEYLLMMYSNERVERTTKKETYVIDKPIISLLGTTVKEAFVDSIKPIWLLDGFLQRFCYLIAARNDKRVLDYIVFNVDLTAVKDEIDRLRSQVKEKYNLSLKLFKDVCSGYFSDIIFDLDNSFARRYLFRVVKYALIFHTLIDPGVEDVSMQAILKGCVLVRRHIVDVKSILAEMGMSELEHKLRQIEKLKQRLGRIPTAREVIAGVRGVKTAQEARSLLSLLED